MKQRLIILSDLWGIQRSQWLASYIQPLNLYFDIQYYDCCALSNIDTNIYEKDRLYQQFKHHGIETASRNLLVSEWHNHPHILAFSIGGIIAWKAALQGLKIQSLFAISSTQLCYESIKPNGFVKCFFGIDDTFKPSKQWFETLQIDYEWIKEQKHTMYRDYTIAEKITNDIIQLTQITTSD